MTEQLSLLKAKEMKAKTNKWFLVKLKISFEHQGKLSIKQKDNLLKYEKIFANDLTNRGK